VFRKIANAKVVDVGGFKKISREVGKRGELIDKDLFRALAKTYCVSANPEAFIYPIVLGVVADEPNHNGDAFPQDELLSFSPMRSCLVYQTFVADPFHLNHQSQDPTQARGFLLDSRYERNTDPHSVLIVAAIDQEKDPFYAEGIRTGKFNTFSMGCECKYVECSVCHHKAFDEYGYCNCLQQHKMQKIQGQLVYEKCRGVVFTELSGVDNPAEPRAKTLSILSEKKQPNTVLDTLGLTKSDRTEIVQYLDKQGQYLPSAMVKLANKLFETVGRQ